MKSWNAQTTKWNGFAGLSWIHAAAIPLLFAGCATSSLPKFSFLNSDKKADLSRDTAKDSAELSVPGGLRPQDPTEAKLASAKLPPRDMHRTAMPQTPTGVAPANASNSIARRTVPVIHTLQKNERLEDLIRQSPGPVLLDFYADWCGPCKAQGRILQSMHDTLEQNNATVIKVNFDHHREVARQFGAKALPTLVVLKEGRSVHRKVGATDSQTIASWLSM